MTKSAIRFKNVSKQFTLHHERPRSFQELFLFWRQYRRSERQKIWVLKDIDFEIAPGEALGIIGSNGAGKSTILKLISRIIVPTTGEVEVNGRVGALLELGAGFHPDLTGRENIYLNGSVLGLSREEVREKIDDIIAFSELGHFVDAPVKHYSSGMYLRLGFSVAVFTDPEILLIDEGLAVGDQNFQHKCVERIMEIKRQGATICFVSHGLAALRRLCSRAIWLDDGIIQEQGEVDDVISFYLRRAAEEEEEKEKASAETREQKVKDRTEKEKEREKEKKKEREVTKVEVERRWGPGDVEIVDVSFLDVTGRARKIFRVGEPWTVRLHYQAPQRVEKPIFGLAVHRNDGLHVCGPNTQFAGLDIPFVEGEGDIFYRVDDLPLMEGTYMVSVSVHNKADTVMYDCHDRLHTFKVRQVGKGERYGLVSLHGEWKWDNEKSDVGSQEVV